MTRGPNLSSLPARDYYRLGSPHRGPTEIRSTDYANRDTFKTQWAEGGGRENSTCCPTPRLSCVNINGRWRSPSLVSRRLVLALVFHDLAITDRDASDGIVTCRENLLFNSEYCVDGLRIRPLIQGVAHHRWHQDMWHHTNSFRQNSG